MEFLSRYRIQGIAGLICLVILGVGLQWRPAVQVRAHQAAFLRAVEDGNARRLDELISADYKDPWGFDRLQIISAAADFRRCFISVWMAESDPEIEWRAGVGLYKARIRVEGTPVGPGQLVRQQANSVREPWTFTWKGTPGLPWRWRLLRIENPSVPDLQGYDPGALRDLLDTP